MLARARAIVRAQTSSDAHTHTHVRVLYTRPCKQAHKAPHTGLTLLTHSKTYKPTQGFSWSVYIRKQGSGYGSSLHGRAGRQGTEQQTSQIHSHLALRNGCAERMHVSVCQVSVNSRHSMRTVRMLPCKHTMLDRDAVLRLAKHPHLPFAAFFPQPQYVMLLPG